MGLDARASIIIPAYNMAATLPAAIDSALSQSYAPLEVIVADDGSTDRTKEVLRQYGDSIIALYLPHRNRAAAINSALQAASGEYLAMLDADDTFPRNSIAARVQYLEDHPGLNGVLANSAYFKDGVQYGLRAPSRAFLAAADKAKAFVYARTVPCTTISLLCRTDAVRAIGGFDPRFARAQDMDFTFRFLQSNDVGYVDATVYNYNTGTHQRTGRARNRLQCIKANALLAKKQDSITEAAKLFLWRTGMDLAKLGFELFSGAKCLPSLPYARDTSSQQTGMAARASSLRTQ